MNNITEIVFILDRSGSMAGLEADTIGGFNAMLTKQKAVDGKTWVSTVLFDHVSEVLHDRIPLERVPAMTERDYSVRGSTALLDAVGGAIRHIRNIHKYARPEDVPTKTMFVITTDGMENASHTDDYDTVRDMIEAQKKQGWEFLFLGANIDAAAEEKRFGIDAGHAANFHSDKAGTALNYEVVSEAIANVRCGAPLAKNWKEKIDADYKKRGGRR